MELRQLETFEEIVASKSMTRAADALALTQPAVTRQISALESEFRTRLFDRLARRVELTETGLALHVYAQQILRLADEAKRAVADVGAGLTGRLAVGASTTAATYLLPPILRLFAEKYAGIELSVRTGPSLEIEQQVLTGTVDVAVVMDYTEASPIQAHRLADYESVVIVPTGHEIAERHSASAAKLPLTELSGNGMVLMSPGRSLRTYVDTILHAAGVAVNVALETDSVETIKRMVAAKLGISILPRLAVADEVSAGTLVALPFDAIDAPRQAIYAIRRKDKYQSAALRAFVAMLESELSDPPPGPLPRCA